MFFRTKVLFGIATLLFCFNQVVAQQDDDNTAMMWYESFFQEENKPVSAEKEIVRVNKNLLAASQEDTPRQKVRALQELGLIYLTRVHSYDSAINYFIESLKLEDSLDYTRERIITYLGIAQVFEEVSDFHSADDFLQRALATSESLNDTYATAFILNKIGRVNAARGKMEDAFQSYERVLAMSNQLNDPTAEANALFNLGHLYQQRGEYGDALERHKKALSLRRSINDRKNEAVALNDIGHLYELMKNDERAQANHLAALEIRQALRDKNGIAESYNNMGSLYIRKKDFKRAITNIQLALTAARELPQDQNQIRKSYELLTHCYQGLGDYKTALENRELYLAIDALIQSEQSDRKMGEIQTSYDVSKRQGQIEKLEADRRVREEQLIAAQKLRNFLYLIIGLGVIIVALVFWLYRQKRRSNLVLKEANDTVQLQNLQLQDLNATKDKFFSIISHDLKGPLNSLTSFSGLLINHADSLSKDEIKMLAQDLDKSLKNLFALLENLLEWSRSQTGNIEFKPEQFDLSAVLEENRSLLHAQAQNKNIALQAAYTDKVTVTAHKNSINTVVRNLLSNAIKFTPEGGTITLGLDVQADQLTVSVRDTGVGMSREIVQKLFRIDTKHSTKGTANEKGTGLGLILCKEFVEKNGGTIGVDSVEGKGSVFFFTLKR